MSEPGSFTSDGPTVAFIVIISEWIRKMSYSVNLVMTVFGFLMSAIFILYVLLRLLCLRFRSRALGRHWALEAAMESFAMRRSSNGLDHSTISLFPTITYKDGLFASSDDAVCTVCLEEYQDKEQLRILPNCGHTFHISCIDSWLRQQPTCPMCRVNMQNLSHNSRRRRSRLHLSSPLPQRAAHPHFGPSTREENGHPTEVPSVDTPLSQEDHMITTSEEEGASISGLVNFYSPRHDQSGEQEIEELPEMEHFLVDVGNCWDLAIDGQILVSSGNPQWDLDMPNLETYYVCLSKRIRESRGWADPEPSSACNRPIRHGDDNSQVNTDASSLAALVPVSFYSPCSELSDMDSNPNEVKEEVEKKDGSCMGYQK